MTPNDVVDLKTFVPAKDFALSRRFYLDLGFTENWGDDQTAELQVGGFRFLLQNFYVEDHAENFMMHLMVEDADEWWTQAVSRGSPGPIRHRIFDASDLTLHERSMKRTPISRSVACR